MVHPQNAWNYHSACPENIALSWYLTQRYSITNVHVLKPDTTVVQLQKTWYYHIEKHEFAMVLALKMALLWYISKHIQRFSLNAGVWRQHQEEQNGHQQLDQVRTMGGEPDGGPEVSFSSVSVQGLNRRLEVISVTVFIAFRARSIYERALDVDHRNIALWLKYAEMEMKSRQVNHARNIWDRAITILPRVNQFWYASSYWSFRHSDKDTMFFFSWFIFLCICLCTRYKYTYMEEMLGNVAGCRQAFERWMEWEPEEQAWHSYINFELRYKEVDKSRSIYEKYILS